MTPENESFARFVTLHLAAEDPSVGRLKAAIARNPDKLWPAEFKAGLEAARAGTGVTREEYRLLSNHEFDSDAEYRDWLNAVWACLYQDGPDPS